MSTHSRVFLSYARQDGEAFATELCKRLEREQPEISLWQDRARMEGGVGWWQQIAAALDQVSFLVVVMTPEFSQRSLGKGLVTYSLYVVEQDPGFMVP